MLNRYQTLRTGAKTCARQIPARLASGLLLGLLTSGLWVGQAHAECTNDDLPSIDSVQSLEQVFDAVALRGTDQVIRADLTAQGVGNVCIWVYEVKLLSSSGEVTNVVYDASALRMIGFQAPQSSTTRKPSNGLLRGIGQRFGFFGRRDPSSEGRADSNRGDDAATASAGDGSNSNTDSSTASDNTDAASGDDGTGVAADNGTSPEGSSTSNTDGESGSSGSSSSSGSTGSSSGSAAGSGGSVNSSGSSN